MTSVLNHRLPLSGSKFILVFVVTLLAACKGTKNLGDAQVMQPTKKQDETRTTRTSGEVDTIYWTEIDRTKEYVTRLEDLELDKKDKYKIALLYPFGLEDGSMTDVTIPSSKLGRMARYYAGTQLALEQLHEEGINLDVIAMDSESGDFNNKLTAHKDIDLIIGPRDRGQLATTAQYGKNNFIPVISPWFSSSKIAKDNPYYIQLKPSLKSHMAAIVEHVKDNCRDDQVFLLGRKNKKDMGMMRYIQDLATVKRPGKSNRRFTEYYIEEDSLIKGETAYDSIFYEDRASVFILPNWSFSEDEEFVYNAVRKLSGEKGLNEVILYGMPILLESDRIGFELYSNLNMRICRTSYLDRQDSLVTSFRKRYYDKYADFPTEEVYKGFDMMLFVGRSLNNYGKKFQFYIDSYEGSLYQTEFEVLKVFKTPNSDKFIDIDYFQNNHLYILEFKENRFNKN